MGPLFGFLWGLFYGPPWLFFYISGMYLGVGNPLVCLVKGRDRQYLVGLNPQLSLWTSPVSKRCVCLLNGLRMGDLQFG